jgi:hypothetical protein
VNPIRQNSWYGSSDFDIRQQINAAAVWQMPFGKGRAFLNVPNSFVQALAGNWQLSAIYRFNTGLPVSAMPYDDARWATNWNVQANVTPTGPVQTCPDRSNTPKLFGGCDLKSIYQSFRNAFPGETGPRNYLREPGYMNADMGLSKTFDMPWNEQQKLQLRWDVFNIADSLEPIDDVVQRLIAKIGAVDATCEYLAKAKGHWVAVPTSSGTQTKPPCARIGWFKQHGLDLQAMYPAKEEHNAQQDAWTWDAFAKYAEAASKDGQAIQVRRQG